jgi:hypothetical protein
MRKTTPLQDSLILSGIAFFFFGVPLIGVIMLSME